MKTCSKCGVPQPLGNFHRNCFSKDGHRNECKLCLQKYNWKINSTDQRTSIDSDLTTAEATAGMRRALKKSRSVLDARVKTITGRKAQQLGAQCGYLPPRPSKRRGILLADY